jgi:rubrerythrin
MTGQLFEVADLVKIAIEDEKSGVAFYSELASRSGKLSDVFLDLAKQERFHQKRFEEMLAGMGSHEPVEEYPGQYTAFLRALTDGRAFPDEQTAVAMARQCPDDAAAVALASRFQRDTLVLLNEMRTLVPGKDSAVVDELAREEQGHLVRLSEARRQLR